MYIIILCIKESGRFRKKSIIKLTITDANASRCPTQDYTKSWDDLGIFLFTGGGPFDLAMN